MAIVVPLGSQTTASDPFCVSRHCNMSAPSFQIRPQRTEPDNRLALLSCPARPPYNSPPQPGLSPSRSPQTTMSSSASTSAFVPRPYPPPSLAGVPNEYILSRLHHLAPHYWNKPETADCTIGKRPSSNIHLPLPGAHLIATQSSMTLPSPAPLLKESGHPSLESPSRLVFSFTSLTSSWISP